MESLKLGRLCFLETTNSVESLNFIPTAFVTVAMRDAEASYRPAWAA